MKTSRLEKARRKLDKHFKRSPKLSKILRNFPQISIAPRLCDKAKGDDDYWEWDGISMIIVPLDCKTLRVLPEDPQEQKFLLAHEIGHSKENSRERNKYQNCKTCVEISNPEVIHCLFAEFSASWRGHGILKKLKLLDPGEENHFWQFVLVHRVEKPYPKCMLALQTKKCVMRRRLNMLLERFKKLAEKIAE